MQDNEIDKIRNEFFAKLNKQEREKEAAILCQQAICVHKYDILGRPNSNGYQPRICSNCGNRKIKLFRDWQGTPCSII